MKIVKIYYYIYDKSQQLIQYYDYNAGIIVEYSYDNNYNILKAATAGLFENRIKEKLYEYEEDTILRWQKYGGKNILYDKSENLVGIL